MVGATTWQMEGVIEYVASCTPLASEVNMSGGMILGLQLTKLV